jgi:exonuclease VII small subunit
VAMQSKLVRSVMVGITAVALAACSSNPTESEEYQALLNERDAIAQNLERASENLEETRVSLGDAQQEAESLRSDLTIAAGRVESLDDRLDETRDAVEGARAAARAAIVNMMLVTQDGYDMAEELGVPIHVADASMALIGGPWETWQDLIVDSTVALEWRDLIMEVDDPELTEAWDTWWDSEYDSQEEAAAFMEVELRLYLAMLERMDQAIGVQMVQGAQ